MITVQRHIWAMIHERYNGSAPTVTILWLRTNALSAKVITVKTIIPSTNEPNKTTNYVRRSNNIIYIYIYIYISASDEYIRQWGILTHNSYSQMPLFAVRPFVIFGVDVGRLNSYH